MQQCPICFDECTAETTVLQGGCAHVMCSNCFADRMRIAAKPPTDMTDSYCCPACKAPSLFVAVPEPGSHPHLRHARAHADELWAAVIRRRGEESDDDDDDEADHTPLPCAGKFVPSVIFCAYYANRDVLLSADMLVDPKDKKALLRANLRPLCDTPRQRSKRGAAYAALDRVHASMRKRRRVDVAVLEEARELVELLEHELEHECLTGVDAEDEARMAEFVVGGGVLYLVTTLQPEGNTHLWIHTNVGTAVAAVLKHSTRPGTSCALIRTDDESSKVLAAVVSSESGRQGPQAIMRALRCGEVGLTREQGEALSAQVSTVTAATVI